MKINTVLTKQFQPEFEKVCPAHFDFSKDEEGDYINSTTQAFWLGFMLSELRNVKQNDGRKTHFIIARMTDAGFPQFTSRPRVHSSKTKAELEAERLSNQYVNEEFAIYRMESKVVNGNKFKIKKYTVYWKDNTRSVVEGVDLYHALERSGFNAEKNIANIAWYDNGITNLYQIRWNDNQIVLESGVNVKQAIYKAGSKKYPDLAAMDNPISHLRPLVKSNPNVNTERKSKTISMSPYFKQTGDVLDSISSNS